MTLHCLYADPASPSGERLRALVAPRDAVVFLGAAATIARRDHPGLAAWTDCGAALYALDRDVDAHGVHPLDARVHAIDDAAWVALAVEHAQQMLWR